VSVIDTLGSTVVATVPVGNSPHDVAVNPAGTSVYVTNRNDNTVSVIDTAAGNVLTATIPVGLGPVGMGEFIMPALLPPVFGKAARACQVAIALSARKFELGGLAKQASCRNRILRKAAAGKDTTLAAAACEQEFDVRNPRSAVARLWKSAKKRIVNKCTGSYPAALDSPCDRKARTFAETADCVLDQHKAKVAGMITMQYGPDPALALEKSSLVCQRAIALGARSLTKLVHVGLAACLNRILKDAATEEATLLAAAECTQSLDPENPLSELTGARAKIEAKIAKKCAAVPAASISSKCGGAVGTAGEVATCVLDEHVAQVAKMVAAEYNGACPMLTAIGLGMAFPSACTGP